MNRREIYDWMKTEAIDLVAEAEPGSLEEVRTRVYAWLAALREAGGHHVSVALGNGPHLCPTCGKRWPVGADSPGCKLGR
jgi:hypothetical protein